MADWTELDLNSLLPGEPMTSAIALAFEENPRAIAEAAVNAPKIADKSLVGDGATVTFSSLDDYSGIFIWGSDSGSGTAGITYSDDNGSTFATPVNFTAAGGGGSYHPFFCVFLDFATGNYRAASSSVVSGALTDHSTSGTIAGASTNITDVRVSSGGGSVACFAVPQGGDSAS
jgi:hypothetical protein